MSKIPITFLLIASFTYNTFGDRICPEHSYYVRCYNQCQPTCLNLNGTFNNACTHTCTMDGCQCRSGYIKNEIGRCVLKNQCKTLCSKNEVLNTCGNGCGYRNENTCGNEPTRPEGAICPAVCRKVCECAKGFVRRKDDKCVLPLQCSRLLSLFW